MKLALTAGGTGGHILPAMVVLDAVLKLRPDTEVRFFGPEDRGERASVEGRGLRFESVPAAGVRGRGPVALVKSGLRLSNGVLQGVRKLRAFGPDVVFSTGGYGSFPASVAARVLRKPLVVYLPDVSPGWAVRAEKMLATDMATTTEAALKYLPAAKTRVTGYPVRPVFFEMDRGAARKALGVGDEERVLVIAGATQGARAINRAVFDSLDALCEAAVVVHVTGATDLAAAEAAREGLPEGIRARYRVAAFREDLPEVLLAADLAVMRAGASVLGELPAAGLPAVLVPGTFAGGHQRDNAQWLVERGAAVILEEAEISTLGTLVQGLLGDAGRLTAMRQSAQAAAQPGAADAIAALIVEVAGR
jgi:UDP-N-acetylglucosamine--N-acetylmuramyl-(pentapeptide) pyrophosphoryl-undecaprenol N-acetylglucosamine transferase